MPSDEPIELRERILAEATRLFVAYGYNGISMREIAETVGVSKAGLYYHFKDKQDLFVAILVDALNGVERTMLAAAREGATTRERVGRLVRALFAQPSEQRAIMRLAGQELAHLDEPAQAHFGRLYQEKFIERVRAILQTGIARGELRTMDSQTATWILLGMMYPFFTPVERGPNPPDQASDLILALFFDGAAGAGA